jgi:hypothetical protein
MSLKSMTASLRTLLSGGKLKDLTMRPVGRASVELDSKVGYSKITRKFVLEGVRVSKYCMEWAAYDDTKVYVAGEIVLHNDDYWECILQDTQAIEPTSSNTLNWRTGAPVLIPIGTEDEEYQDHFLVDQKVMPGATIDQAYIQRTFVEFRKDTWSSETVSEGGDLKRMNRKYVILRSKNDDIGYSDSTFIQEHPQYNQKLNTGVNNPSVEPWPWIPNTIKNSEPVAILNYTPSNYYGNSGQYSTLGLEQPMLEGDTLYNKLTDGDTYQPKWVRGPITVDMSNPGFDVWSVTWVAPVTPHWLAYGKSTSSYTNPQLPQVLTFSHRGVKLEPMGDTGGFNPGSTSVWTYIWYYVGAMPSADMIGLSKFPESPSVNFDFHFSPEEDRQGFKFTNRFKNTLWKPVRSTQNDDIYFPATNLYQGKVTTQVETDPDGFGQIRVGNTHWSQIPIQVASGQGLVNEIWFDFTHPNVKGPDLTSSADWGEGLGRPDGNGGIAVGTKDGSNIPLTPGYQGIALKKCAGLINYTYDIDPNASYSSVIGYRVKPIFSHGDERIWKIEVTYAS